MSSARRNVLVTGGAGFIGSALCRHLVHSGRYRVVNVDKLTYAGNLSSLQPIAGCPAYRFERIDIADSESIGSLLRDEKIDLVMHLAAETHVDRSIRSPAEFVETNVVGTFALLQCVLDYWQELGSEARTEFRFHHSSTDEVFGDADDEQSHAGARYRPSSPYSASKAAADHLVMAWHRTYGLPVVMSHSSNNYGPYQLPDKLIPLMILNALEGLPLPVYGAGTNVRNWIHVEDHARALELVVTRGGVGQSYQIGHIDGQSNLEIVRRICKTLDHLRPLGSGRSYAELITFVADRPGHDHRYAVDPRRAKLELGWSPLETLDTGLARTVSWYVEREDWWGPLRRRA